MRIELTSILVDDQDKALEFYTKTLGFVKKQEFPAGPFKWLTVVSPEQPDGPEISLEPNENPVMKKFQTGLFDQGIPANSFGVDNLEKEVARLKSLNVKFSMEPTEMGPVIVAAFDDTCGNIIQMHQLIS